MKRIHRILWPIAALGLLIVVAVIFARARKVDLTHDRPSQRENDLPRTFGDESVGPIDLMNAADFHFALGDGSGLSGYNVVKVGPDGGCEYTFRQWVQGKDSSGRFVNEQQWKRTHFLLNPATMHDLRQLLVDVDFVHLRREYHANVADGTQRWAMVDAGGQRKGVYCDNYFPRSFQKLHDFVNEQIIKTHTAEMSTAKTVKVDPREIDFDWLVEKKP